MVLLASWMHVPTGWALLGGLLPSFWAQTRCPAGWRRVAVVAGLPLSAVTAMGIDFVPVWVWLGASALLLALYPVQSWADAPVFPTPRDALTGLGAQVSLPEGSTVLDAGSGMGHGMVALRRALPKVKVHGVESSWPLVLFSRFRGWRGHFGPRASWQVRKLDMWSVSWSAYPLVYLFQRPETMERAWRKARLDMAQGAWLVSLEFEVPGVHATACLTCPDGRDLWIYRVNQAKDSCPGPPGR